MVPDFETFRRRHEAGRPQLVHDSRVADLQTPVGAYLKLTGGARRYSLLLESVEGGATRGRYSMIALEPDLVWRCDDGRAAIDRSPGADSDTFEPEDAPPLDSLRRLLAESAVPDFDGLPPMAAGLFGFLGYDFVRELERLPAAKPDPTGLPDALLMRPSVVIVFDAVTDQLTVVTPVRPSGRESSREAYDRACQRVETAARALERAAPDRRAGAPTVRTVEPRSNLDDGAFESLVGQVKAHIAAGDIFQAVLSQRFEAPFDLPAFDYYRALRRVNPAPFLCFLDLGERQIACSSPEILVRLRDGIVTVRPIAGTRARGRDAAEDRALERELLADEKERAEHLMLLDLGRNDVGRVSAPGTVRVTEAFGLERYAHVMHIVSNVEGELRAGCDALDALCAGFPAGTVSGAPKVRAMEIIDALEPAGRGVYGGAIGYFGAGGDMDTCIALRTAVLGGGRLRVQAGAGLVHDSVASAEQAECEAKARALFRAAEEALRVADGNATAP